MSAHGHALRLRNQQDINGTLAHLPVPAFVFGKHTGRILACNSRFEDLMGYSRTELFTLAVEDIQPSERIAECHEARTNPPPRGLVRWQYRRKDSSMLDVRVHYRELDCIDESGKPLAARFVVVEFWQSAA